MYSKECKLYLEQANMTRWQHFRHALSIAWNLKKAAIAVFIHAFAPRYFKSYASETCDRIAKENKK